MNAVELEIKRLANEADYNAEKESNRENNAPCSVCNGRKLVQKFRNVVGDVHGEMHGHFSLFGGSVHGYIDGETKTLPVLSCRECGNERLISTWQYTYEEDLFWSFMIKFYLSESGQKLDIDPFFLERPLETRQYMQCVEKTSWSNDKEYREMLSWETSVWASRGFKIPSTKKRKITWKLWKKEYETVYPSWETLTKRQTSV